MRVLHFFKTYYPETRGGVEQVIHQIAQSTAPYGIQSDILTLSEHPESSVLEWQGERIHQVKCQLNLASTRFSLSAFKAFSSLLKEVDLVHYQYPWPFMDMVHFAVGVNKPTVVSYQSDIVRQKLLFPLYRPLGRRFLNSVTQIIASSPAYLESSPMLRQFRHKTQVIPIGIPFYNTPIDPSRIEAWKARCGGRFLLFVGVLRYYKGLHVLLAALKDLHYPIVIAGSGPLEESLKQQAAQLGLHAVHFVGAISEEDKFALLKACEGFVFPSHLRSEAFGVSLLEAAMMAKPLICCELQTGTSYINLDGVTGWVVKPNCPEALKEAMQALWTQPEQARARGLAARARYEALFTAEKMGKRYAELYSRLVR